MEERRKFLKKNLENKLQFIQDEHKKVIQAIYNNAVKINAVSGFSLNENITQFLKFSALSDLVKDYMSKDVLYICLVDLCQLGFIIDITIDSRNESAYTISILGLEYLKEFGEKI